jgi:predicted N-acetyltransferase YhbS
MIRPLAESDSVQDLTSLLHRAYARLAEIGFRFTATHQSVEVTRGRCSSGSTLVAVIDGGVVGTVTFYNRESTSGCEFYDRPEVASFGQFAVEPALQRLGIGSALMDRVESLAHGFKVHELALDTAEGALHLIDFYSRRGYRQVGLADWSETNYRSVVMSKRLHP